MQFHVIATPAVGVAFQPAYLPRIPCQQLCAPNDVRCLASRPSLLQHTQLRPLALSTISWLWAFYKPPDLQLYCTGSRALRHPTTPAHAMLLPLYDYDWYTTLAQTSHAYWHRVICSMITRSAGSHNVERPNYLFVINETVSRLTASYHMINYKLEGMKQEAVVA